MKKKTILIISTWTWGILILTTSPRNLFAGSDISDFLSESRRNLEEASRFLEESRDSLQDLKDKKFSTNFNSKKALSYREQKKLEKQLKAQQKQAKREKYLKSLKGSIGEAILRSR